MGALPQSGYEVRSGLAWCGSVGCGTSRYGCGWVRYFQVRFGVVLFGPVRHGYTVLAGRDVQAVPPCLAERLEVGSGSARCCTVRFGDVWLGLVGFGTDLWRKVLMVGANPTATIEAKAFMVRYGSVRYVAVGRGVSWSGPVRISTVGIGSAW